MSKQKGALKYLKYYEIYRKDLQAVSPKEVDRDGVVTRSDEPDEVLWLTVFTFLQVINHIFEDFQKENGRFEYSFKEFNLEKNSS